MSVCSKIKNISSAQAKRIRKAITDYMGYRSRTFGGTGAWVIYDALTPSPYVKFYSLTRYAEKTVNGELCVNLNCPALTILCHYSWETEIPTIKRFKQIKYIEYPNGLCYFIDEEDFN